MDSVRRPTNAPSKSRIARVITKVLHVNGLHKAKTKEKIKSEIVHMNDVNSVHYKSVENKDEQLAKKIAREAHIAKIFASISSIKASYAHLQLAQSPYDAEAIQSSDEVVVLELKTLSELKQCFLKKQFDPFPEKAFLSAEVQEQKSLVKTYEITGKKLESQVKVKGSQITFLKQKLEQCKKENKLIESRLNASGSLSVLDNLHMSGLSPNHFIHVLRHAVRSIRSFVKLLVTEMQNTRLNLDSAANVINPGVIYLKQDHKCFTFESFVCSKMFDSFQIPNFGLPNETLPENQQRRRLFFERFTELKSVKGRDYLHQKPKSTFGKFCKVKYLKLVHPKLEISLFGDLHQRDIVSSGDFPDTNFFTTFAEMAKRVWLLHCLAFAYEPTASIFQIKRMCRYSEVYMESVSDETVSPETEPLVSFTVVPGFKIGKTVIQSQVYLSSQ